MPLTSSRKKRCGCLVCRYEREPVDFRVARKHVRKYGKHCSQHDDDAKSTPPAPEIYQTPDGIQEETEIFNEDDACPSNSSHEAATDISEDSGDQCADSEFEDKLRADDGSEDFEHTDDDASSLISGNSDSDEATCIDKDNWSFEYDKTIYESGLATQIIPSSGVTVLQWLALNFNWFVSHPSISKSAFTDNLKIQKMMQNDANENSLPSSYYEARKLIDPYVVKKKTFDVCTNDCILFRKSKTYNYTDMTRCPICQEERYINSAAKRPVSKRRFIYIPLGPRLARLFGDVNLAQLVMSHPGSDYSEDDMWDIHHSTTWRQLYSENGYFKGDRMGISLALELDGVNPFHNIGVMYSMTPIMLTILNLPRNVRNAFGNINLVGIIPGSGKSEATKYDPYLDVLVDELLFLTGCKAYSAYDGAPIDVKVKLLLYILDYPGLSKLFHQHGSGSLAGCHWCVVRGEKNPHLDKVIYLNNRSYLEPDDPIRLDDSHFAKTMKDESERPKLRCAADERSYREAFEKAKNKTHANLVATATGCKQSYALANLPGHSRLDESLPDSCHTIKDVVQNIMKLVAGNNVHLPKIISAEKKMNRLHLLSRDKCSATSMTSDCTKPQEPTTCIPVASRKRAKSNPKEQRPDDNTTVTILPFLLTTKELKLADVRAKNICVPLGFGLKPSPFISKQGSLKSHDWKQLATQGILKFCIKGCLSNDCRKTLFFLFDSISELCQESIDLNEIDHIECNLNTALALLERDFPMSLANITTHMLHHIPDGIRRYGPVYGTWMFVFERFNSWICKRVLNMRYPEATAVETFIVHDWCNFMLSSGRMPATGHSDTFLSFMDADNSVDMLDDECRSFASSCREVKLGNRDMKSIHRQIKNDSCESCSTVKYHYHKEVHPVTKRVSNYTSETKEVVTAHTVSSFICCEFDRGPRTQKVQSGKFVAFGRISFFLDHKNPSLSTEHHLALVKWFEHIQFDKDTALWYTRTNTGQNKLRSSYVLTKDMSQALVTAEDEGNRWFLNSGKLPFEHTH